MTPEQQAAYIRSQTVCAEIELTSMIALNKERESLGHGPAYDEEAFLALPNKYGIHHNAVMTCFTQY